MNWFLKKQFTLPFEGLQVDTQISTHSYLLQTYYVYIYISLLTCVTTEKYVLTYLNTL